MINILKMDLQRFWTNKVIYLLLLIFAGFQVFGLFMLKQYNPPVEEGGLSLSTMNQSEFIQQTLSLTPSWVMLYIVVFSVYFYMSEYNSGFYKSYMTMKHARPTSVISKIVIQAIFTLMMFVVMIASDLIARSVFFNNSSIGDVGYFAKLVLGQVLLHWAFSVFILCVAMFTRSIFISIGIGFVLGFNVIGMLWSALESLFDTVGISKYLLVNTIVRGLDYNNVYDLIHVGSVAIISLLLFGTLAVTYKLREDLR